MSVRYCAALAAAIVVAAAIPASADNANSVNIVPSSLLAVEQNRQAIVDGIILRWRESLNRAWGAQTPQREEELRGMLMGLRADRLLSVSLAGSVEGLSIGMQEARAVIGDGAVEAGARTAAKALGSAGQDVVYTPLVPCRIVDTRGTAPLAPQVARTFVGFTATDFTVQGGIASNCGIPNGVVALVLNISAVQPQASGFLRLWPTNLSMPFASMLNYTVGTFATATGTIVPVDASNDNRFSVWSPARVDFVADVAGYFKAPGPPLIVDGGISNAMLAAGSVTLSKLDTASVDTRYARKNSFGLQMTGFLDPGNVQAWTAFGFPAASHIQWRVMPTTAGGKMQLLSQEVELALDGTVKYYLVVRNTGSIDANYAIQHIGLE